MNDNTRRGAVRKVDTRLEVKRWLDRGILSVPIKCGQKKPTGGEGWNELRITEATIDQHFRSDDSLGGLWGKPSGWIIDVDLDCDEAVIIANHLLPETFIYGRSKRPRSHYLYKCVDAVTAKWMDANKEMIVELRSTGSQSVLPPSIHPENDRFAIEEDRDFASIGFAKLKGLINRIAALSLLAREYPSGKGRHDYISAVAGALSHSGIKADEVVMCCIAVLDAAGDREDDVKQRERTIRNTIEKSKDKSNRTYGWPKLGEYIESALSLSRIKRWLGVGDATSDLPEIVVKAATIDTIPTHLLKVDGLVGDIAQWASRRSYVKQPLLDLATGLTCMAMCTLNRYVVEHKHTPLQPYLLVLALTGGGKESALSNVYEFCLKITTGQGMLGRFCFSGFQSWHSMIDQLQQPPAIACMLWDEAGRKLKSVGKSSGSQDFQIVTHLLSLYGKGASHVPGNPARHNPIPALDNPYLTILATSQPDPLMQAVSEADMQTGMVNRFLLLDTGDVVADDNDEIVDVFPSHIKDRIKSIHAQALPAPGEFRKIPYENGVVLALYKEFGKNSRRKMSEIWARANQNAMILAGIVAVGMAGTKPVISEKIARWSIEFVSWCCQRWEARIGGGVSRSKTEEQSKSVERIISDARMYENKAKREVQKAYLRRGLMPKSILTTLTRHIGKREKAEILSQLIEAEVIGMSDDEGGELYWKLE